MESIANSAELRLDALLDSTQDGVLVVDRDRRVVLFNDACERLTGFRREEVLGTQCRCREPADCDVEDGRSLIGRLCPGRTLFDQDVPGLVRQRLRMRRRDGRHIWAETSYTPLPGRDGQVSCVLAVVRDITAVQESEQALRQSTENLREQLERLRGEIRQTHGFSTLISRSKAMQTVFEKIRAAAENDCPVLITGEGGTGKELVARTIHETGVRKDGQLVPMSCSSTSPQFMEGELFGYVKGAFAGANIDFQGLLRAAEGGTLFLDEITGMSLDTQAKLLRVLEEGRVRPLGSTRETPVNARIVAATSFSPVEAVAGGRMRKDLYYRLGVVTVELPPLRERKEDIPFLVQHFLTRCTRKNGEQVSQVAGEVWPILFRHDWPGNVRELRNAIESAVAIGQNPQLESADLPELIRGEAVDIRDNGDGGDLSLDEVLASVERRAILSALRRAGGQRSQAARAIGISRSRLYRRMEALGIRPSDDL